MSVAALVRCGSYRRKEVYEALRRGISLMGGLEKYVPMNDRILVKPNMLRAKEPGSPVTVNPVVFGEFLRILREEGAEKLVYGDSPGIGSPAHVASAAGFAKEAEEHGVSLGNFNCGREVKFSEGVFCKKFDIAEAVLEADSIISIAKMKTHMLTRITGAVKNQLGCVYGLNKAGFHSRFPNAVEFSGMLVDLNRLLRPKLFILDGITAMEGNGPASGESKEMGFLLISDDPVFLDALFADIVRLPREYVPTIYLGEKNGLGSSSGTLLGDETADFFDDSFEVVRRPVVDESLNFLKGAKNLFLRRPFIDEQKCVHCGICVDACPVVGKALNFRNGDRSRPPVYDYDKCIRCYCCQEMCPKKAIGVKTPLLGRLFFYRDG